MFHTHSHSLTLTHSDVLTITIDKYKELFQKASQEVAMHICTSHGHYMYMYNYTLCKRNVCDEECSL